MTVRIDKTDAVTTITIDRPEARNAIDPTTADALYDAFLAFENDNDARVAVLTGSEGIFCAGFDLKTASELAGERRPLGEFDIPPGWNGKRETAPRGPMSPTHLFLEKPMIAAIAGPAVAGGMELALMADAGDGGKLLHGRFLPPLRRSADRRRHGPPAPPRRHGPGDGPDPDRAQGGGEGMRRDRSGRAHRYGWRRPFHCSGACRRNCTFPARMRARRPSRHPARMGPADPFRIAD
ncbi:enoyl-CoA hydratase-related protein [Breoghania sp.]|uniref:enoyl-CoA hydratase-related protein n=1 Tax=Breoghania sp. TaxID=2065378 RepID=UPI0026351A70|nr:enoyl-CoA hydratase-related protein [Breoghania sp.]MDJ0929635.1 enoyl-CoA hydratase-related protein [Breoghania sp.]